MYLSRSIPAGIFVSQLQTTRPLRNLVLTTIIILWTVTGAAGQQVWPGDINNNGIVNNIDVLYWAVANGATGAQRSTPTTDWVGQDLPATLWEQNFPEGLNYAYADCDGDGDVDDDDKAIIESNFGEVHGMVVPDEYATGEIGANPQLLLSAEDVNLAPEDTLEGDLSLGTETDSITNLYGIAFTLVYDPDVVSKMGNAVRLDILEDTWLNGQGDEMVIQFRNNDRDNGITQFAIVRKDGQPVSGFGEIGKLNIVMEDIVVGKSDATISDIRTVTIGLENILVAPSKLEFTLDTTLTGTRQQILNQGMKLYPNPASSDQITLELDNPQESIRLIQLFDMNGRLLLSQRLNGGSAKEVLQIGAYPAGIYTIKLISDKHLYVKSFYR